MYYYVYNLQGDVTHIIDATGAIKGIYQYDAWGKIVNLSSLTAIAQVNPFRYRGYYYDTESGLYYLNSRYYNAEWGRFINADGYVSTGQGLMGYNMFAYCGNNPANNVDPNGTCFYNANGVWCHDNWEYLGGYVRQPDPNTYNKTGINNKQKNTTITSRAGDHSPALLFFIRYLCLCLQGKPLQQGLRLLRSLQEVRRLKPVMRSCYHLLILYRVLMIFRQ